MKIVTMQIMIITISLLSTIATQSFRWIACCAIVLLAIGNLFWIAATTKEE